METRIRRNIIILVVVTFLALIGMSAGWFFVLVRPQKEEIATVTTTYQQLQTKASKLKVAQENERKAKDKLEYLNGQLAFFRGSDVSESTQGLYRRLYFGAIDGDKEINIAARQAAWRQWMNEYHSQYGPALQLELRRIAALAGVFVPIPAIKVDDPPQKPEDVKTPNNGFLKPLSATNGGQITLTVSGNFANILRFLEYVNNSSILMVVGNIKLEGYQPNLKATFPITPYLIAAGPGTKLTATSAPAAGAGTDTDNPTVGNPTATRPEAEGSSVKILNPRLGA